MSTWTIPLSPDEPGPSRSRRSAHFGLELEDEEREEALIKVVRAVRGAKRVVVICGKFDHIHAVYH